MTKEEKIREAYEEINAKNLYPRDNGWSIINSNSEFDSDKVIIKSEACTDVYENDSIRNILIPKSLQGIEDNNGWTRIKNENSITLPEYKKGDLYEVYNIETESSYPCRFTAKEVKQQFDYKHITHYRLMERTKFPIY